MCKCVCTLTPVMSDCDSMDCSPQASLSLDSPGKSTGVGCCAVLQGIFPTQGWNLCLMSPALPGGFFTTSATWEALWDAYLTLYLQIF